MMITEGGSVVIYQGSKYFWKTRNTIEVALVVHQNKHVIEVIAYEPSLAVEAPRLYLDLEVLIVKLDLDEVIASKMCLSENITPQCDLFEEGVISGAISEFVLNRLFIKHMVKEDRAFEVQLQLSFSDRDDESGVETIDKLVCDMPASLDPHFIRHHLLPPVNETDGSNVKNGVPPEVDAKILTAVPQNILIQEDAMGANLRANTATNAKRSPKTLPNTPTSCGPTSRHSLTSVVLAAQAQTAYMDGTTTSESRNKAAAKEKALEKEKEKTARKRAKRGSKSKPKKQLVKSNSWASSNSDNEAEYSSKVLPGLISQFFAGLASLSASVSGKHSMNKVYVEETDMEDMVTSRASRNKSFGSIPEEPSESGFTSGMTTSRLSRTVSGICTPIRTSLGDHSDRVGTTSCDELEGADPSEMTSSPRRRQIRFSLENSPEDSDGGSARTRNAPFPSNFPAQTPRTAKLSANPSANDLLRARTMKCANPHNQVRFNEVTGMYERQLTASTPIHSHFTCRAALTQVLGGVVQSGENLRSYLSWR